MPGKPSPHLRRKLLPIPARLWFVAPPGKCPTHTSPLGGWPNSCLYRPYFPVVSAARRDRSPAFHASIGTIAFRRTLLGCYISRVTMPHYSSRMGSYPSPPLQEEFSHASRCFRHASPASQSRSTKPKSPLPKRPIPAPLLSVGVHVHASIGNRRRAPRTSSLDNERSPVRTYMRLTPTAGESPTFLHTHICVLYPHHGRSHERINTRVFSTLTTGSAANAYIQVRPLTSPRPNPRTYTHICPLCSPQEKLRTHTLVRPLFQPR